MRVVFFGTADFGLPTLEAINASPRHEIIGAVTGPDKPRGRGLSSHPTPIGEWLEAHSVAPVFKPSKMSDPEFVEALRNLRADAFVVVAFRILPETVYSIPKFSFNLHASLLPAYRGAAPIQRAIMAGETITGVTTFLLEKQVDTGSIIFQQELAIGPVETAGELMGRLASLGAGAVIDTLDVLESGRFTPLPQDPAKASPAPKITNADLPLVFDLPADRLIHRVRALAPRPGATTVFREKTMKILALSVHSDASLGGRAGEIVAVDKKLGPVVATGNGAVVIGSIQPAGKKPMTGAEFARGYHPTAGERFQ